jgi:archaellin
MGFGMGSKKAEGIGVMIMFLAAIIVAGIAASVLLSVARELNDKALLAGKRTKEKISVATEVLQMYGEDGTNPAGTLRNFYMRIRIVPGGNAIKLDDTFLGADFVEGSADLYPLRVNESERNCTPGPDSTNSGFWTDPTTNKGNYSYVYLVKGANWHDRYLTPGDVILVCFRAPYEIPESDPVGVQFLPKPGTATVFETATPDGILDVREFLYP